MDNYSMDELRELAKMLRDTGLESIEITKGDYSISMKAHAVPQTAAHRPAEFSSPVFAPTEADSALSGKLVTSPIVGIFYRAPAPGAEPFVSVGSRVEQGDTLCVVEAMKLMNEITAEFSGEVVEILVQNGEIVDFGRPLIRIREL